MDYSRMQCVSQDIAVKALRFKTEVGDTLISMTGANVGKATRVWSWDPEAVINQRVGRFVPKYPDRYSKDFIHYLVTSYEAYEFFKNTAYGSAQPNISGKQIESLPIPDLSADEAMQIGSILSALDDKIELNRRIAVTLEEMARALYRSWFVDFDPVKAKAEGLAPAFMDEATAALFPDRLGDDGLPEGWMHQPVKLFANCLLGGTPSRAKPEYWDGCIPWINSGAVNKFRIITHSELISEAGLKNSSTKILPHRTTVLAITGATLGQVSLTEMEVCANQSVVGIVPTDPNLKEVTYCGIKETISDLISHQTGGAQQHINKGNVENHMLILADKLVHQSFSEIVGPYFDRIASLLYEARTLTDLRDTLLPKLMSGELRVGEARDQIEEVA